MSAARFWSAFAVLFLLAALPVLSVELPPLFDYPNHLARMDLLARLPGSEALQRYYEPHWRVIPNLGMDLVVPTLVRFLPLAWAGKAFVLASLALLAAGPALVHRAATGRWSLWPLSAFLSSGSGSRWSPSRPGSRLWSGTPAADGRSPPPWPWRCSSSI